MARIPIIRSTADAPTRTTARATPAAFGAQAAGAALRAARAEGVAARELSEERSRAGVARVAVAGATARARRQTAVDAADISDSLAGAGDVALDVYAVVQDRRRRDQDVEAEKIIGEHGVSMQTRANELAMEAAANGDGYSETVLEEFDKSAARMVENASSNYQRKVLERGFARQRVEVQRAANRDEIEMRQAKRRTDLEAVILQREAAAANNPRGLQQNLDETIEIINASNIRPTEKQKMIRAAKRDFTKIAIGSLNVNDPISALELLQDEQVQAALGGDIVSMRNQSEIALDRADRRERRAEREASEAAEKEGHTLAMEGQLTPEWLEQNYDTLDATAYRQFSKILRDGPKNTDIPTYVELSDMVMVDPAETMRRAGEAYAEGKLTQANYNSLVSASRTQLRYDGNAAQRTRRPVYYSNMRSYIAQKIKVPSMWDAGGSFAKRAADAQMEFDRWMHDNPDAKRDDAEKKAHDIIKDYSAGDANVSQGKPLPYGYEGSIDDLKEKHLNEAKRRILDSDLPEARRLQEMANIHAWRKAMEQKNATR